MQYNVQFDYTFLKIILFYFVAGIIIVPLLWEKKEWIFRDFIDKINTISLSPNAKIALFVALLGLMTLSFYNNSLHIAQSNWFNHFQKDTEASVLGKIIADRYDMDTEHFGLVYPYMDTYIYGDSQIYQMLQENTKPKHISIYRSNIGIQGFIASFLYNTFNLDTFDIKGGNIRILNALHSFITAFIVLILSILLGKILGRFFGVVFFASLFLSPWMVCYGNNLYHVISTWLLPAVFAFLIFLQLRKRYKDNQNISILIQIALFICFGLSMFGRSLCSYEYLTSIMLFASSVFFIALFLPSFKIPRKVLFRYIALLFGIGIFAFLCAFILHTYIRGNGDIWQGLRIIYENDFLRRMIGGKAENFAPAYADSLNASITAVIWRYLWWKSPIIFGIHGVFFPILLLSTIIMLVKMPRCETKKEGIVFLVVFSLPALSWFVFGKAHSYIHTHMNFMLWYLGFVASLFYIFILSVRFYLTKARILDK